MAISNPQVVVVERGQDATITVTQTPAEDITGWTLSAIVRAYNGGTALVTKTVGSGITLTTPSTGVFTITFSASDLALTPGAYVWEVTRTNSGYVFPVVEPSSFIVRESSAGSNPTLTNLSEVSAILNLPTITDDQAKQYLFLIGSAEASIRTYCGRKFTYGTYTEYLNTYPSPDLFLRENPVSSVTSVHVDSNAYAGQATGAFAADTELEQGVDFYLDTTGNTENVGSTGRLIRINSFWGVDRQRPFGRLSYQPVKTQATVKVVYVGGYNIIPYDLKTAIATMVNQASLAIPKGGLLQSESSEGYSYSLSGPDVMAKIVGSVSLTLAAYRSGSTFFA